MSPFLEAGTDVSVQRLTLITDRESNGILVPHPKILLAGAVLILGGIIGYVAYPWARKQPVDASRPPVPTGGQTSPAPGIPGRAASAGPSAKSVNGIGGPQWMAKAVTPHGEKLQTLFRASNEKALLAAVAELPPHDVDAVTMHVDAHSFCAGQQEHGQPGDRFDVLVQQGVADTPQTRASYEYLQGIYGRYCDGKKDYYRDMVPLAKDLGNLDRDGGNDFQIYAGIRNMPNEQRMQYTSDLHDILSRTDSPTTFSAVSQLLMDMNDPAVTGGSVVNGSGVNAAQTANVAAALATCQVAGTCDQVDNPQVLILCAQRSLCYPGITLWSYLQDSTPPVQFTAAQQLAQQLLSFRRG